MHLSDHYRHHGSTTLCRTLLYSRYIDTVRYVRTYVVRTLGEGTIRTLAGFLALQTKSHELNQGVTNDSSLLRLMTFRANKITAMHVRMKELEI